MSNNKAALITGITGQDGTYLSKLLLDKPQLMGVESIGLDTVNLRMVARTLPGKQFEVGRRLRVRVVRALRRAGVVTPNDGATPTVETIPHPAAVPGAEPTAAARPDRETTK